MIVSPSLASAEETLRSHKCGTQATDTLNIWVDSNGDFLNAVLIFDKKASSYNTVLSEFAFSEWPRVLPENLNEKFIVTAYTIPGQSVEIERLWKLFISRSLIRTGEGMI